MMSMFKESDSTADLMAGREIHKLLVLKILNFLIDLNSLTCSGGTWEGSASDGGRGESLGQLLSLPG